MRILKASYIIPLNADPIKNGYLFIEDDGTIIHYTDIAPISNDFEVEEYEGILCPGFVNTHCHLELSHMKGLMPEATGLPKFVSQIPTKRNEVKMDPQEAFKEGDRLMQEAGVIAVGDICNTADTIEVKTNSNIRYHSFVELFGLDKSKANQFLETGINVLEQYKSKSLSASLVPHAPYSVSPQLLERIYQHAKEQIISIHHQETPSENELFIDGKGDLMNLFEKKGLDLTAQKEQVGNSSDYSLLQYLPKEQKVLLVHNTCSGGDDIDKVEGHFENAYWCTCPKANWYIERTLPNYDLWREKNLKITVGTDSLASNDSLSILEELKIIQKHFPNISTEELLSWACKNGADLLGYDDLGAFASGSNPGVVLIENVDGMLLTKLSSVKVLA